MNPVSLTRIALASLVSTLALAAAAPLAAQEAERVPGNKYVVANQTGAPLACRYRVNSIATGGGSSSWRDAGAIAAGAEFTRTAEDPGESVSLECGAEGARGRSVTVQPGRRYAAEKADDGKVAITRVRS